MTLVALSRSLILPFKELDVSETALLTEHDRTGRESWERLWKSRKRFHVYENIVRTIEALVPLSNARILEVGFGRGATLLVCAEKGAEVAGVDYAESAIGHCRQLQKEMGLQNKIELLQGDARSLPLPDRRFDVVYSVGLLEHFTAPEELLREQCRVLKPGGFLLVHVPQKYSLYTPVKQMLIAMRKWPYGRWETQFSVRDLKRVLSSCGLNVYFYYGYGSFTLALLRHFFFPTLGYASFLGNVVAPSWLSKLRAHFAMDVCAVARKPLV
jgi:SAM-dependent methyltransferase